MPAFITNGPDIPERLLQAHEEGNVVFFCGSGISYPAGLPDFGGLVKAIYDQVGVCPNDVQHAAIKTGRYDTAVGLLEDDIAGGREKVRKAISEILTPDFTKPKSMATHEALLKLGQDRKGRVRLITTNFDRIFEEVITKRKIKIERFMAPLLPIPKNQWDGLVYLHGLLPSLPKEGELDRLVVSSGDFGLAYLTERWASRFVSELFRRYSVCFVGYSINDPVLRYMVDALAVDRSLGESRPEMFAFGSYSKGKEKQAHDEWKAKRVTPILYRKYRKHIYLHRTLQEWSRTYRDGVRGKEMIIAQHASTRPLAPSRSDFAVGRVLWALTDEVAAKHFADMNPVPPLKWLEPLSERQFGYEDLPRFGVTADSKRDEKLQFSILDRPAPYTLSPWMCIADRASPAMNWDNIMSHLARWLTRHMNDPALILWLAKSGGQLHELFLTQLSRGLERLDRLKAEGKLAEINQIRSDSPNAIPNPLMRTLWRLLISGRVKSYVRHAGFFDWLGCLKREGLTPLMRMELRENLKPCVTLREPYHWGEPNERLPGPERIKDLVDWDIALHSDDVHSTLRDQADNTHWLKVLPDLLPDFFCLLRDTLDLMGELGGADEKSDFSYIHQPSISDHPQNRNFQDWTVLIELVRDAWLCVVQVDKTRARRAAEEWWQQPYPVFKRLAFFAAAQKNIFPPRQGLNWILADDGWWLWAVETTRETLRLLVALAPQLSPLQTTKMEQAILTGPPREMFKDDIDPEELTRIVDREVWLRLAKLEKSGAKLGTAAKTKLKRLTQQYPTWELAPDGRDEFPFWMGEDNEPREFIKTPRECRELINYLKEHPKSDWWIGDDWRQRCRDDFSTTACALIALAKEGVWLADRWREALQAWTENNLAKHSWQYMGPVVNQAPDDVMQDLSHSVGWWLQVIAKTFEVHEPIFFKLCRRILAISYEDNRDTNDAVTQAINHPVGLVTEALLRWWYRQPLQDGQGLSKEIKPIFTSLSDTRIDKFRHGRVLLATHVVSLYRVDPDWATKFLLPMFEWHRPQGETRLVWEGFLWSSRLYGPFLSAIKQPFLETATRYEALGEHADRYAQFLTFAALDPGDIFTTAELADATRHLPVNGLIHVAQTLTRALEGAGGQRDEYWRNRMRPYLHNIWPKYRELMTPSISENLARLCIAADESFPDALHELKAWLQPEQDTWLLVRLLHKKGLCKRFPTEALAFLDKIVDEDARWLSEELQQCLNDIKQTDQLLSNDSRFVRLAELCRRRGR